MRNLLTIKQACGHTFTWRPWRAGEVDLWGHGWTAEEEAEAIARYQRGECLQCFFAGLREAKNAEPIRLPAVAW